MTKAADYSEYRVLVVDDDEIQREVLTELVKGQGALCDAASSAAEALGMLRNGEINRYQMIITDIRMPDEDGLALARKIRDMDEPQIRTIPIIGVSADTDPELYDQALMSGMNGMVLKPMSTDVLAAYFTLMFKSRRASSVFSERLVSHLSSERKMREFVSRTSRALRGPMSAIHGFAEMLMDENLSYEHRRMFAESICTSVETVNKLLNDSQIEYRER